MKKTEVDWFFDAVEFDRQSIAAILIGIISILSGLYAIVLFDWISGGIAILSGIALTSLGARKVPDYSTLAYAIEDYIKQESGNSKAKDKAKDESKDESKDKAKDESKDKAKDESEDESRLRERYEKGELSKGEFENLKKDLENS